VFANIVLRTILGPRKYGLTVDWRKLHSEELHDLYSSPDINLVVRSKRIRWVRHVWGDVFRVLVGNPEVKRTPGGPRHSWENNIKLAFQEIGWEHGLD
jgi:hypothetical protein